MVMIYNSCYVTFCDSKSEAKLDGQSEYDSGDSNKYRELNWNISYLILDFKE